MLATVFKSGASTSSATPAKLKHLQIQWHVARSSPYPAINFRDQRENGSAPVPRKSHRRPEVGCYGVPPTIPLTQTSTAGQSYVAALLEPGP